MYETYYKGDWIQKLPTELYIINLEKDINQLGTYFWKYVYILRILKIFKEFFDKIFTTNFVFKTENQHLYKKSRKLQEP